MTEISGNHEDITGRQLNSLQKIREMKDGAALVTARTAGYED